MHSDGHLARTAARARLWADDLHGDIGARVLRLRPGSSGHALYDAVRDHGPFVRSRRGLLFTASYAAGNHVLRSDAFGVAPTGVSRHDVVSDSTLHVHPLDDAFLRFDPPRHTELRRLVAPGVKPHHLAELTPRIEQTVDGLLDRLASRPDADLVTEYAEPLPVHTICHLLGLPPADAPRFTAWGRLLATVLDGSGTPRAARRLHRVIADMSGYFQHRLHHRPPADGEGLIDVLARRCPADLTVEDVIATGEMLLLGGFTTTAHLIGNAAHTLLRHPPGAEARHRTGYADVVEESLRHDSPVQYTVRVARTDTEVSAHPIRTGTPVVVLLAGANRDPAVFHHPHSFDASRPGVRRHLAFGAGIHFCLGAALARVQAETALTKLFDRYPHARLHGPARMQPSRVLHGPARLPVRLRPTRRE